MTENTEPTDAATPADTAADAAPSEEVSMTAWEETVDIAKTVAVAVGVTLLFRFFLFQPFNIPSASMVPTLLVGDFIVVDKVEYGYSPASLIYPLTRVSAEGRLFEGEPQRGDIAVFKNSRDRNKDYIKRIVGLPGDTVQVRSGVLHINGQRVERVLINDREPECAGRGAGRARLYRETLPNGVSYVVQECKGDIGELDNTPAVIVEPGHYFMMGDNRDNSQDSRTATVGQVPINQMVGEATRVAFSVDGEKSRLWELWNWPGAIRYGRLLDTVE